MNFGHKEITISRDIYIYGKKYVIYPDGTTHEQAEHISSDT
jgi:hypothetical protein